MKNKEIIYGVNPILEAIRAGGRRIGEIVVEKGKEGKQTLKGIIKAAEENRIAVSLMEGGEITALTGNRNHQGVAALVSKLGEPPPDLRELANNALKEDKEAVIAILDEVSDPGNLGAIIRSAEVLGVKGIVIPKDRAAQITPVVIKRSAGAAEHIPIATVNNITKAIEELKELGFWVVGLEKGGDKICYEFDFKGPIAVVIGGEAKGIRRLVKENCDFIVSIPMKGKVSSLNASSAATLIFYEIMRQRETR
ncbi:MAG: 23S rRNA (guanosine(2251)-2'-O)-methyltransferase RlmB [Nitrospinota bacterium]